MLSARIQEKLWQLDELSNASKAYADLHINLLHRGSNYQDMQPLHFLEWYSGAEHMSISSCLSWKAEWRGYKYVDNTVLIEMNI